MTIGAATTTFAYDPFDYRIEKVEGGETLRYFLEGEHLELVKDASWVTKARYLRGVVIDEVVNGYVAPEGNVTFHHDALQSVTGLSTHTGEILDVRRYLPFGTPFLDEGTPPEPRLQYTGRELDAATGLYYYRARYYDPTLGRFLQEDPLGFGAGANFYAYVGNNPLVQGDPTGLCPVCLLPPVVLAASKGLGLASGVIVGSGALAVGSTLAITESINYKTGASQADVDRTRAAISGATGSILRVGAGYAALSMAPLSMSLAAQDPMRASAFAAGVLEGVSPAAPFTPVLDSAPGLAGFAPYGVGYLAGRAGAHLDDAGYFDPAMDSLRAGIASPTWSGPSIPYAPNYPSSPADSWLSNAYSIK